MNYKKYKYCIPLLVVSALPFIYCSVLNGTTATRPADKVVFFDDFSSHGLDRSKWNVEVTGTNVNGELQAYVDSAATIYTVQGAAAEGARNGALVLHPRMAKGFKTSDGRTFDFISGRVNTRDKFEFMYGTAEARIKMTAGAGLWPAWWMLGDGMWPETGEVDIMEYVGERDWVSAAVHGPGYSGETPFVNRQYFNKSNDVTQWHNYAVEWTPQVLLFKYDGVTMFRVNRNMAEHYGKWAFNNKKFLILDYALGGIYPFKINGVKEPYYGMPASTLNLIKNNQPKMMVDWVKVTKNNANEQE